MPKSNLSFKRFMKILEKHKIEVTKVMVMDHEIVYIFANFDGQDFLITIPDKYVMIFKKDTPFINISYTEEANNATEQFIKEIVNKLDSDIVVISNNFIFDSYDRSYKISGKIQIHHNTIGLVDLLEKQSKEILKDMSIKFSDTIEVLDTKSSTEKPDLNFFDYDGSLIPKNSNYADMISEIDKETERDYGKETERNYDRDYDKESERETERDYDRETERDYDRESERDYDREYGKQVIWELSDFPLKIGKVFKLLKISDFFEDFGILKIKEDIRIFHNEFYNIEQELRKEKYDTSLDLRKKIEKIYLDSFVYFESEEKKLNNDKTRLENVISSLTYRKNDKNLKTKEDIVNQAEKEIKNINIKLLKVRDKYNEYFDNYIRSMTKELETYIKPSNF